MNIYCIENFFKKELGTEELLLVKKGLIDSSDIRTKAMYNIYKRSIQKAKSFNFNSTYLVTKYLCLGIELYSEERIKINLGKKTFKVLHKDINYKEFRSLTKDNVPACKESYGEIFDFGEFRDFYRWLKVSFKEVQS